MCVRVCVFYICKSLNLDRLETFPCYTVTPRQLLDDREPVEIRKIFPRKYFVSVWLTTDKNMKIMFKNKPNGFDNSLIFSKKIFRKIFFCTHIIIYVGTICNKKNITTKRHPHTHTHTRSPVFTHVKIIKCIFYLKIEQ